MRGLQTFLQLVVIGPEGFVAQSVTIDPIGFKAGSGAYACTTHQPKETTTYVVTAHGADGDQDSEKVTVKVH